MIITNHQIENKSFLFSSLVWIYLFLVHIFINSCFKFTMLAVSIFFFFAFQLNINTFSTKFTWCFSIFQFAVCSICQHHPESLYLWQGCWIQMVHWTKSVWKVQTVSKKRSKPWKKINSTKKNWICCLLPIELQIHDYYSPSLKYEN